MAAGGRHGLVDCGASMHMRGGLSIAIAVAMLAGASAPLPNASHSSGAPAPVAEVHYELTVDSADRSGYDVEVRIAPELRLARPLRLAVATLPESNVECWRAVSRVRASVEGRALPVFREDSSTWRVGGRIPESGIVTVRYRIELDSLASTDNLLSDTPAIRPWGGLVGGVTGLLYVVGETATPARVTLRLPQGWRAASALDSTDAATLYAPDAAALLNSPILVGRLASRSFRVRGVEHHVAFLTRPGGAAFDTTAIATYLERATREVATIFGPLPYQRYAFLLRDDGWGAVGNPASMALGILVAELDREPGPIVAGATREVIHAWTGPRLRAETMTRVATVAERRSAGAWWSEGLTAFFADAISYRAGLRPSNWMPRDMSLAGHYAGLLDQPANVDNNMRGELLANLLDLAIRDSTDDRRSLDDLARETARRFPDPRAVSPMELGLAASSVCGCNLRGFFNDFVQRPGRPDLDRFVRGLGYRAVVQRRPALMMGTDAPGPDRRISVAAPAGRPGARLRLTVERSDGPWARAGLRTGDELVSISGRPVSSAAVFAQALDSLRIGDSVRVVTVRAGVRRTTIVVVDAWQVTDVQLEPLPDATPAQLARRTRWLAGH